MGLLGNKDKDTKAAKPDPTPSPKPTDPLPPPTDPSLSTTTSDWRSSLTSTWQTWKTASCGWCESQTMKDLQTRRKQFYDNFCHPLGNAYRSLPEDITAAKFQFISKYDQNQRLLALEAITLLFAISSLKTHPNVPLSQRLLFSLRNSAGVFALGGLLLAPEIYNPLIKSDF